MAICVGSDLDCPDEPNPRFEALILCGGRGTFRPAGEGMDLACVSETRPAEGFSTPRAADSEPRDIGDPLRAPEDTPRAAATWLDLDAAGGVIRLTVGRENAPAAGRAPGLAFAPSILSRVGLTLRRLSDCAPFRSFGVKCTELP